MSYGGGVQSTALLVLAAQERIDFRTFVMANVGDDSEHPATLRYVREVAMPYADEHGIALHLIDRVKRDGTVETLWGRLNREGSRSLPIPVRMSNGAPGQRSCTADFKIRVTGKWAKQHGATATNPAVVGIGISADEIHRANNRRIEPHERIVYPLIGFGEDTGLRMTRQDCANLIRREPMPAHIADRLRQLDERGELDFLPPGELERLRREAFAYLPVPPKSSCFFCPFHRPETWDEMARTEPELFERAAQLEDTLNERRDALGKDPVYLTRFGKPLRLVANADQGLLDFGDELDNCDSGWCMT
ncbi:MAG TPA: hypothetical protein VJ851_00820 [Jatrophihabitans sp.]|nr:hypothetical protein [Jatrophihabitans sp.]